MMYTISYTNKNKRHYIHKQLWKDALYEYKRLRASAENSNIAIRDNEYGTEFIDNHWQKDENLVGWCSK